MKRRTEIITLLFCLLVSSAWAQTQQSAVIHEFSIQQCIDYGIKNNVQVKNAILDLKIQEQTNKSITASAYPQINGSIGGTYYPNVAVQSFPNFIAAATYGVLEQEGVKDKNG
ncbi:MAG TPA: TolC family protein, partial [Chitinophagaceae bacterium]|nr:TolC family protein [Chitinophagaceae bacterium]